MFKSFLIIVSMLNGVTQEHATKSVDSFPTLEACQEAIGEGGAMALVNAELKKRIEEMSPSFTVKFECRQVEDDSI
jgi:hypothetical protein